MRLDMPAGAPGFIGDCLDDASHIRCLSASIELIDHCGQVVWMPPFSSDNIVIKRDHIIPKPGFCPHDAALAGFGHFGANLA